LLSPLACLLSWLIYHSLTAFSLLPPLKVFVLNFTERVFKTIFSELSLPIKGHLFSHYGGLKRELGSDFIVLDTQQSEKSHKSTGKDAFANSNKQYGAELKQMCTWVLAVEGALAEMYEFYTILNCIVCII
jgi:hypothetical protein